MHSATDFYQQLLAESRTSLRPGAIKAYGVKRFLAEQAERGPLQLPKLHFTEEEDRLMDELLAADARPSNASPATEPQEEAIDLV